jgi:hypothetical protein
MVNKKKTNKEENMKTNQEAIRYNAMFKRLGLNITLKSTEVWLNLMKEISK